MVAALGEAHPLAGLAQAPAALAVGHIQLQVERGHRADLQPPLRRRGGRPLQFDPDPPGIGVLADAGAAVGRPEARLHGRVGHVLDAQLATGVFQQGDMPVQFLSAAVGLQLYGRGLQPPAEQAQAQHQQQRMRERASHRVDSLNRVLNGVGNWPGV